MEKLRTCRSNTYLVEINIHMSYMPVDNYIQEASLSHGGDRFYVTYGKNGGAGGRSIGTKSVTILASGIHYLPESHFKTN